MPSTEYQVSDWFVRFKETMRPKELTSEEIAIRVGYGTSWRTLYSPGCMCDYVGAGDLSPREEWCPACKAAG